MPTFLDRVVTPGFIAFNAHCWFAYAVVITFPAMLWYMVGGAVLKEFYIDAHFETGQTFADNLQDFAGYAAGIILAVLARSFL